jgi:hypothetical protein
MSVAQRFVRSAEHVHIVGPGSLQRRASRIDEELSVGKRNTWSAARFLDS